jgi:hypothetical protein
VWGGGSAQSAGTFLRQIKRSIRAAIRVPLGHNGVAPSGRQVRGASRGAGMTIISDAIALCDEVLGMARKLRSKELRQCLEEYARDQKEALEALRKMIG